jgi:hypothetical protein
METRDSGIEVLHELSGLGPWVPGLGPTPRSSVSVSGQSLTLTLAPEHSVLSSQFPILSSEPLRAEYWELRAEN